MIKEKADTTAQRYANISSLLECPKFTYEVADQVLDELKSIDKFLGYSTYQWAYVRRALYKLVKEEPPSTEGSKPDDGNGGQGGGPDKNSKMNKSGGNRFRGPNSSHFPPKDKGHDTSRRSKGTHNSKMSNYAVRCMPSVLNSTNDLDLKIKSLHDQSNLQEQYRRQIDQYSIVRDQGLQRFKSCPDKLFADNKLAEGIRLEVQQRESQDFRNAIAEVSLFDVMQRIHSTENDFNP